MTKKLIAIETPEVQQPCTCTWPQLFTPAEVSEILRISRGHTYELIRRRKIPSLKLGASRRVSLRALNEYIANEEAAALAGSGRRA